MLQSQCSFVTLGISLPEDLLARMPIVRFARPAKRDKRADSVEEAIAFLCDSMVFSILLGLWGALALFAQPLLEERLRRFLYSLPCYRGALARGFYSIVENLIWKSARAKSRGSSPVLYLSSLTAYFGHLLGASLEKSRCTKPRIVNALAGNFREPWAQWRLLGIYCRTTIEAQYLY